MPLVPNQDPGVVGMSPLDIRDPATVGQEAPGAWDVIAGAWRQDNTIASAIANKTAGVDFIERDGLTGDEVWKDIEGTRYEGEWERFAGVFNRKAMSSLKSQIDMETEDRRNVEAGGLLGVAATLGAAIIDPVNLIPVGGSIKAGGSVARIAGRTAVAGSAGAAIAEVGLQATQETRTALESGIAIGGGAILGGVLGAGIGKLLSRAEAKALTSQAEAIYRAPGNREALNEVAAGLAEGRAAGVGAEAVDRFPETLDDNAIMGKGARAVGRALAPINPLLRAAASPSSTHRSIMADLAETGYYLEKNAEGRGNLAVETMVKYWERGVLGRALEQSRSIWKEARKAQGFDMTEVEFREAVGRAMRRNDEGVNPFVSKAAKAWRSELFDPLKSEAVNVGILPSDVQVTTAASYFSRMYNHLKLTDGEGRFKETVNRWLDESIRGLELRKEEITFGNKVSAADEVRGKFDQAFGRLESIEQRMEKRKSVRGGKMAELSRVKETRMDALKDRAPEGLVKAFRDADENEAAINAVKAAKKAKPVDKLPFKDRYPVLNKIKQGGGVRTGSFLAGELRAMGATPQTFPGLFSKTKGLGDVDNFVRSEMEDTFGAGRFTDDGNGYVDRNEILELIRSEIGGSPLRTLEEEAALDAAEVLEANTRQWLESVGLSENASVKEVRDLIKRVTGAEKQVDELDTRAARLEREIDEFDQATDAITGERNIADAEARNISDQLDKMEQEIEANIDLVNASPKVKIIVDYARTRRDLFKAKMAQQRAEKRVDALKRLEAEGRASPEQLMEITAKSVDVANMRAEVAGLIAKSDKLKPMVPRLKQELPDFVSPEDRADYIKQISDNLFDTLTGRARFGGAAYDIVLAERGPLKERTFNIPDELIEEFLENDVEMVGRRYARIMSADVELSRKFGKPDLKEQADLIREEYRGLRETVEARDLPDAAKQKELRDLRRREEKDIKDIAGVRDLIRGTYETGGTFGNASNFARVTNAAMTFNYMRVLGGVLISSISDSFRPVMVHGLAPYFKDILTPAFFGGIRGMKMSAGGAKRLGAVTERLHQSRIASMAELNDPYSARSPFERFVNNAQTTFTKMTLLPYWNDMQKGISSIMTQSRIIRNVRNYDTLSAKERAYMGYLGIDADKAAMIRNMDAQYGETVDGVIVPNADRWPGDVQRMFAAALNKDVDATIVTKGVADVPLFMHTPAGRALSQFKSFAVASNQRVLMRGLQEDQGNFAVGVVGMVGLGMMIYALKQLEAGREISDNPAVWLTEGIDRSGILSLAFEVNNAWEKSVGGFGVYDMADAVNPSASAGSQPSRFASRTRSEAILGPMFGFAENSLALAGLPNKMIGRAIEGEGITESDIAAIRRMTPFASLPYFRFLIDGGYGINDGQGFDGIIPDLKEAVR